MLDIDYLFINKFILLFFYIDGIAVIYDRKHAKKIDEFEAKFFNIYEIRNLGEIK